MRSQVPIVMNCDVQDLMPAVAPSRLEQKLAQSFLTVTNQVIQLQPFINCVELKKFIPGG